MAKFFVGQRVGLIKTLHPENLGKEGVITEIFEECDSTVPRWPINCRVSGALKGNAIHTSCLEPILPEGAQPSEFSFTELMDNLGVVVA